MPAVNTSTKRARGFYESLIVTVDNPAPNMFTPVYLVLYTSKAETMYEAILHLIHRDTGKKMSPAEVVCRVQPNFIRSKSVPEYRGGKMLHPL
ncbi:hypothetical protein F444_15319 [Phytophthora nicotianae P1976]|uniref:MULE transposase domain-containing protein n=1 Tax=Phytophthora nicotianae P1976 TaxID=1317066 RepID=A0A080ZMD0_PHYNI|nr:hypothetical protein F444_15319 [Phytophthora nicotianae P1976]